MDIKINRHNIIASKTDNNNDDISSFDAFLATLYNNVHPAYISDCLVYTDDDLPHYEMIIGGYPSDYYMVHINVQDYVDYYNTCKTLLSFVDGYEQETLYNLVHYGTYNPTCILEMENNNECDIYFNYNDIDNTTFDIWSLVLDDDTDNFVIDFTNESDYKWYIKLAKLDIVEYEEYESCTRDAYVMASDGIASDFITVSVNEHIGYYRANS